MRVQKILEDLDEEQRRVATSFDSPVIVLAGAGTGKTRAITHRIAYGVHRGMIDPHRTLAVTFTTKAAQEMRERLTDLSIPGVQTRTFHSAALRQLRYFWPRVYGTDLPPLAPNPFALVAEAARGIDQQIDPITLRELLDEISWCKVSNVVISRYEDLALRYGRHVEGLDPSQVASVIARYEQMKRNRGYIDFNDILLCSVAMLAENRSVREEIQQRYRHFTVDEFQDVSPLQFSLLELWMGERADVCIVGDVNQCIHSFAGADPRFLRDFSLRYPQAVTIRLIRNYRCSRRIVQASNRLVDRSSHLLPVRDGGEICLQPCSDEAKEWEAAMEWLTQMHRQGIDWEDMAILYRVNAQSELGEQIAKAHEIPYQIRRNESVDQMTDISIPNSQNAKDKGICLSTIHAAKGLEWEAVAIISVNEGMIPFYRAIEDDEVEEEDRLFYVATTRAKRSLYLSWSTMNAQGKARQRSRYLDRLGVEIPQIKIKHSHLETIREQRSQRASIMRCSVCSQPIWNGGEKKLGRHMECEVTYDERLFERLKSWREGIAERERVPSFAICTDMTLRAIAEKTPTDMSQLLRIQGIGRKKAEKYGLDIIEIVKNR